MSAAKNISTIMSNQEFLRAIAGDIFDNLWVCSYGDWRGGFARTHINRLDPNTSAYVAAATLPSSSRSRSNTSFETGWLIVLDDVGEKLPADFADMFAPEPTYKIMTSPGNEQWGYRIFPVETDVDKWNAFYKLLRETKWEPACDNSGLAAYKRLPVGKSGKPDAGKKGFPTHLTSWNPEITYTLDDLAKRLGIKLTPENIAKCAGVDVKPSDPLPPGDEAENLIYRMFDELGMIKSGRREGGWFDCVCPWQDEHSTNPETGTAIMPGRHFKCHHSHCTEKTLTEVEAWLMQNEYVGGEVLETAFPAASSGPSEVKEKPKKVVLLTPTPFTWTDPSSIPPREWLYNKHYIRKFVSGTGATGGTGKSSLKIVEALAMASGKPLLGADVIKPLRVWYWCGEDPRDEILRRVMAAASYHGLSPEDLGDRFLFDSGRDPGQRIVMGETVKGSTTIFEPMVEGLRRTILENKIDVMIIDPFVSSHKVTENDNNAIDAVAKAFGQVAGDCNCAIELVHHLRKLNGVEATTDAVRGGVALLDACRSFQVINVMSEAQAGEWGLTDHWSYIRATNGKPNMAPRGRQDGWFHLAGQDLWNGTPEYPDGDNVGVAEKWEPPVTQAAIDPDLAREIQVRIARTAGPHYRRDRQAKSWAGHLIGEVLGFDTQAVDAKVKKAQRDRAERALQALIAQGVLRVEMHATQATNRQGKEFVLVGDVVADTF